jgi:hypothetical protein
LQKAKERLHYKQQAEQWKREALEIAEKKKQRLLGIKEEQIDQMVYCSWLDLRFLSLIQFPSFSFVFLEVPPGAKECSHGRRHQAWCSHKNTNAKG